MPRRISIVFLVCGLILAIFAAQSHAGSVSLNIRVNASTDDAQEDTSGARKVTTNDSSLEMGANNYWCGMRFNNVTVPKHAYIVSAYVTFTANTSNSSTTSLRFYGEDVDSASTFVAGNNQNIGLRTKTTAFVDWTSIPSWTSGGSYSTADLRTIIQEIVTRSGWASGNSLAILVDKNSTAGQRLAKTYDTSTTLCPLLHIDYVVVANPVATRLLLVVVNSASLTTEEANRKTMFQTFGYTVTPISATASQASFDTAAAANDVAYICQEITSTDLNTKLKAKSLGIVNEEPALSDDFELVSSTASPSATTLTIAKNNHHITSPFALGSITVMNSSQPLCTFSGTFAAGYSELGTIGGATSLFCVEAGGMLTDSTRAAGRRVQLPWGGGHVHSQIAPDGIILLSRALAWGGGVVAYWKLDESSGTTASDSSVNVKSATLNGFSFTSSAITKAKVDGGLTFDGVDDYVSTTNASVFQLTKALSISAWVQGSGSWGSSSYANSILRKGDANPNNWQLAIENGYVALGLDGTDGSNVHGDTLLETGRWYHVVGTWDGSYIRIYVNGILDNTPTIRAAPINTDTRDIYIGGRTGSTDLFKGKIDDVRLFNHALDADEVSVLKGQGRTSIQIIKWVEIQ